MENPPVRSSLRQACITWLKSWGLPLLGLVFAVAVVTVILVIYFNNPDLIKELQGYGYLGAFVISIILNGTVLIPVSNMAVMASLGATLPLPFVVGIAGGFGAGIGEFTGYLLGRSGRGLLARNTMYNRVEHWVGRWGWAAVVLLSAFPLVFDVVGIISGALRMPAWRFFLACTAGRIISYTAVAYLGALWLKSIPWWAYIVVFVAIVAAGVAVSRCGKRKNDSNDSSKGI